MTDEFITHNLTEPPELAPAVLVEWWSERGPRIAEVSFVPWAPDLEYRVLRNPGGHLYVSAEGLHSGARWVATDSNGDVLQTASFPNHDDFGFYANHPNRGIGWDFAPETHRHPGDWRDSLCAVWREDHDE